MTIQIPNPGTGNGATGDNEFVLWSKVKDNFSDQTNAASRLVGTGNGNIPTIYGSLGINGLGYGSTDVAAINYDDTSKLSGLYRSVNGQSPYTPVGLQWVSLERKWFSPEFFVDFVWTRNPAVPQRMFMRAVNTSTSEGLGNWTEFYTTSNTTKEEGTGYLVASSPVLKVQHDNFEKVHEAEQLDIDVQRVATGVYEITGTTGLRDNDGWYLKPPKDVNGNVLCICEVTQDDDVITLKTYKKKFDFETVSIAADYEQPTDIPEGAEVMIRFNDLPAEPMPQGV